MRHTALVSLTQAVESYLSAEANHITDAYASMALQIISENIVKAVKRPHNKQASIAMANAAVASAAAFHNLTPGAVHTLGMALAKLTGHHPGLCMGALLPASLKLRNSRKGTFRDDLLLYVGGADIFSETAQGDRSQKGYQALMNLISSIPGLTQSLADLKIAPYVVQEAIAIASKNAPSLKKQDFEAIIAMM
jgi:alcohol dehydrogenase class IV